jgi:hypothetical protein
MSAIDLSIQNSRAKKKNGKGLVGLSKMKNLVLSNISIFNCEESSKSILKIKEPEAYKVSSYSINVVSNTNYIGSKIRSKRVQ